MKFMDLAARRRSIRRFTEKRVSREDLVELVRAGMSAPSGGNAQPWQFIIVEDAQTVRRINKNLGWLGGAPEDPQQARAHVVVLLNNPDNQPWLFADAGAAAAFITLAATEKGIGSCCVSAANRDELRALLGVPNELQIFSVIALGYPAEEPATVEVDKLAKTPAHREAGGRLLVQKLTLETVCHLGKYGQKLA